MTYVKINGKLYPATVNGKMTDREWDNRESKAITLEMGYAEANEIFVDGLPWSIVQQEEVPVYQTDEQGGSVQTGTEIQETVWDNSEFSIAGTITDNRNGTNTVKMGKPTEIEVLQKQLENVVTEEELNSAYVEGVNCV